MFTNKHKKFWQNRKINWEQDYLLADGALNHPHRQLIINRLIALQENGYDFRSVFEVGMGAGANLVRVKQQWPAVEIGGIDINRDAVLTAGKYIKDIRYCDVGDPRDIMLSDRSIDIALSDACLIYFGPREVRKALNDMKRVARKYIVLCELHSEAPWYKRMGQRYNIHNYRKILEELDCYDIWIEKIPKEVWPGTPWEQYGHIISASFAL